MKCAVQMILVAGLALAGAIASYGLARSGKLDSYKPLPLDYAWSRHVETAASEKGLNLVSLEEAQQIAESFSHIILDARKPADYAAGHLPGAMSLPLNEFDETFPGISPLLGGGQAIMVYCSGRECDESIKLGEILIKAGYTNITLFAGGMIEWKAANLPVEL